MLKKGTFSIALHGLTDSERRVVRSLCVVSSSRPRAYAVAADGGAEQADLWIVDGADQKCLTSLDAARKRRRVPALIVGCADPSSAPDACIRRPLVASRLLNALDLLVTKDLAYLPELVIGGGTSASAPGGDPLANALQTTAHPKRFTALVVDDSATIRKQIELALKLHDIEPTCAETGEAAMAFLDRNQYDLIFLDVVLPGDADGYQICRSIKKNKAHRSTPVIMLTGRSSTFDRVRGSLAGCDTYLTKPVENHTFNSVLKKYLKDADAGTAPAA
ncbi:MAG: response regulator [Rhodocyclaceae bacterium]